MIKSTVATMLGGVVMAIAMPSLAQSIGSPSAYGFAGASLAGTLPGTIQDESSSGNTWFAGATLGGASTLGTLAMPRGALHERDGGYNGGYNGGDIGRDEGDDGVLGEQGSGPLSDYALPSPMRLAQAGPAAERGTGSASAAERGPWVLQLSGLVYHWLPERCKSCDRRTFVPGIGIQRELSDRSQGNSVFAVSAGVQTDSFGCVGSYFAATGSMRYRTAQYEWKPGVGAFMFYRTMDWSGKRQWIPAVLPFMAIEHAKSGIGVNFLFAPNFRYGSKLKSGFAFVQLTYRF